MFYCGSNLVPVFRKLLMVKVIFVICSLARQLNLKRFTANSEVATTVIHSPVKNVVEELLNVSS